MTPTEYKQQCEKQRERKIYLVGTFTQIIATDNDCTAFFAYDEMNQWWQLLDTDLAHKLIQRYAVTLPATC